jgi:hypothetical protein
MNEFLSPIIFINGVSLIIMVVMLLQFRRIHHKRISLLSAFQENGEIERKLKKEHMQRRILIFIYILGTIAITAISSALFFYRPDIF